MKILVKLIFEFLKLLFKTRQNLILENLMLRQQLNIYKRKNKKPKIENIDRILLVCVLSASVKNYIFSGGVGALELTLVVPRHPVVRTQCCGFGVLLQFGEIVERIDAVEFAGVDQAHEQVSHAGSVLCLIEVGVFAVQNSLF